MSKYRKCKFKFKVDYCNCVDYNYISVQNSFLDYKVEVQFLYRFVCFLSWLLGNR